MTVYPARFFTAMASLELLQRRDSGLKGHDWRFEVSVHTTGICVSAYSSRFVFSEGMIGLIRGRIVLSIRLVSVYPR